MNHQTQKNIITLLHFILNNGKRQKDQQVTVGPVQSIRNDFQNIGKELRGILH